MKTQEDVLAAVKGGRESDCIDGRDYARLSEFFPASEVPTFGFELNDGAAPTWRQREWTPSTVMEQLRADVAFGFEKAIDKRGISANAMFYVVRMWLWILEDELYQEEPTDEGYAHYGLPLLKAVAVKFGFPNAIGDDLGSEPKYSSEGES